MKKTGIEKVVLAYSGGLDTSYCVPYLKERYGCEVITVTVDTGGYGKEELSELESRALELGAVKHLTVDAKEELYDEFLSYLIKGDVLRGGVYPISVGAERVIQAEKLYGVVQEEKADAVAHGCTPAGNDQVRFDVYLKTYDPELEVIAPIRKLELSRKEETDYLKGKGIEVREETTTYSVNTGLWGTTIGGGRTHQSWAEIPEEAYAGTASIENTPDEPVTIEIKFEEGLPKELDGDQMDGVSLIRELNELGGEHGVGRGIHLGETILGIKGRVAFEAPAPLILIEGHEALERSVLSKEQQKMGGLMGKTFGEMLHEARYYDPVVKDIKEYIDSEQKRVTGEVKVKLFKGNISAIGCRSPYSLMDGEVATYGEGMSYWSGEEAAGFCKLYGLTSMLCKRKEVE